MQRNASPFASPSPHLTHTSTQFATSGLQPLRPLVLQIDVHSVHGSWYVFRLFFLSSRVAPLALSMSHGYGNAISCHRKIVCVSVRGGLRSDGLDSSRHQNDVLFSERETSVPAVISFTCCLSIPSSRASILLSVVVFVVAPEMRPLLPPLNIRDPVCRCSSRTN